MRKPGRKFGPPAPEALVRLFAQLAIAARSELALGDAMRILAQDVDERPAAQVLYEQVAGELGRGASLSDALQRSGAALTAETLSLVRKAEETGCLAQALDLLARDSEHRVRFRTATRAAAVWPLVSLAVFFLVLVSLAVFVVPQFEELFANLGGTLPAPTRLLTALSRFIESGWMVWIPALALAIFAWVRYRQRWEWLRARMDGFAMRAPVVRSYLAKTLVSRLSSVLVAAAEGAPLAESLAHLRSTLSSRRLADRIAALESRVAQGMPLAEAVAATPDLPGRLRVAVELGQRTNRLGAALRQTQDLSDEEAERSLVRLEQMALVLAYFFVGVLVAFMVLAMYLPIFKMGSVI